MSSVPLQSQLIDQLHAYMAENNPDLLISLQQEQGVTTYLTNKVTALEPIVQEMQAEGIPAYVIEQFCIETLTADLRPSRYQYLRNQLEEAFPNEFENFREQGVLTYELCNLISRCEPVFERFPLNEYEDNRNLQEIINSHIRQYLNERSV